MNHWEATISSPDLQGALEDDAVDRAREFASAHSSHPSAAIIEGLCAQIDSMRESYNDVRRDVFREAVQNIAAVIRNRQHGPESPLTAMVPGGYGSPEELAAELERTQAGNPVTIAELRRLRMLVKNATEGSEEIDALARRIYYGSMYAQNAGQIDLIPPGSPSKSVGVTAYMIERMLPDGWWTLGSSGTKVEEAPVSKVGSWDGDDPRAASAPTPALALLLAFVSTLIEIVKQQDRPLE